MVPAACSRRECNCCKTLLSSKMQSCASRLSSVASNDRRRLDHGAASLGVLPATEQGAIIAVSGSHRLRSLSKGDRQKATRKERGRRRVCRSGVTRTHRDCRGTRNVAPPNSVLQSLAICRRHKIKKQGLGIGRGSCQFWVCQSVLLQFMLVRLEGGLQRSPRVCIPTIWVEAGPMALETNGISSSSLAGMRFSISRTRLSSGSTWPLVSHGLWVHMCLERSKPHGITCPFASFLLFLLLSCASCSFCASSCPSA